MTCGVIIIMFIISLSNFVWVSVYRKEEDFLVVFKTVKTQNAINAQ